MSQTLKGEVTRWYNLCWKFDTWKYLKNDEELWKPENPTTTTACCKEGKCEIGDTSRFRPALHVNCDIDYDS